MKHSLAGILCLTLLCSCGKGTENLALFHKAYSSSSIDYDCAASLLTDGIAETQGPAYMTVSEYGQRLIPADLPWLFDFQDFSCTSVQKDSNVYECQIDLTGYSVTADALELRGLATVPGRSTSGAPWLLTIDAKTASGDWEPLYSGTGRLPAAKVRTAGEPADSRFSLKAPFSSQTEFNSLRVRLEAAGVGSWSMRQVNLSLAGENINLLGLAPFRSCWVSASDQAAWVSVDLGELCRVRAVEPLWLNVAQNCSLQASEDGLSWHELSFKQQEDGILKLSRKVKTRFIRLSMTGTRNGLPMAISELRVLGRAAHKAAGNAAQSGWMLARASEASRPEAWIPATVPGTVLASYIDCGAVPDPAWSDNNKYISDSYFRSDFIYRGTVQGPAKGAERVFLEFDGINWKADVSLNGKALGSIEGAFKRASFDVTGIARPGANQIEVYIHAPEHMFISKGNTHLRCGYNGGVLGADNPTFHASIGWDWIPSVRGRNMGIWNDVRFRTAGPVTIADPYAQAFPAADSSAAVTVCARVQNHSSEPQELEWRGSYGGEAFSQTLTLQAGEQRDLSAQLTLPHAQLWWPNGYGEPHLYNVDMAVECAGAVSDSASFRSGVRRFTYSTADGTLRIFINGRRFIGRGGNWGFSEFNLRFRESDYDMAVRYHADQNFTMIRNWVGQIGDDEFYDACDRYGIVVWQDFWLANPWDGPNPDDEALFLSNADDLLLRTRRHPSIGLYCGRNEGYPPETLDAALAEHVGLLHPDIVYIPSSADGVVGGRGNYYRQTASDYFSLWGSDRFHSERGMPNICNYESLLCFIPEDHLWPQDDVWGAHDFAMQSAQRGASFNEAVCTMFGQNTDGSGVHDPMTGCNSAREFCDKAQWVNYDGYRAIFESRSQGRRGMLLWMSHSCWPSLVWSTYDYFFEPTASYFGCKKANEPLHIQWNPVSGMVELVNWSAGDRHGLGASAELLDMYGRVLQMDSCMTDSPEDSTVECFRMQLPQTGGAAVYYLRLSLSDGDEVSSNFYVLGEQTDNFQALGSLPAASLNCSVSSVPAERDGELSFEVTLTNVSDVPALMLRLIARDPQSGERLLPVIYSDNYIHLMPHEQRKLLVTIPGGWKAGGMALDVTGFNLK